MPETDDSQLAKARLVYPAMDGMDHENKYQPPHPPRLGPSKIASEEGSLSDNLWGIFENSLAGRKVEVYRIDFEQLLGLAAYIKLRKLFDPHRPLWDKNKSGAYNTLSERCYGPKSLEKLWGRIICRAIPCECSPKPK